MHQLPDCQVMQQSVSSGGVATHKGGVQGGSSSGSGGTRV
jgi:hypothetical protein